MSGLVIVETNPLAVVAFGAGPQGPVGPLNMFIQNAQPTYTGNYLWLQTGLPGGKATLWLNTEE